MENLTDLRREKLSSLKKRDPKLQVQWEPTHKQLTYARGKLSKRFSLEILKENPFNPARKFLQENKELFGNIDMKKDLTDDKKVEDDLGMTHVSFQQHYHDIPVFGGSVGVHFNQDGRVSSVSSKLVPDLEVSVDAEISASDAEKAALAHAGEGAVTIAGKTPRLIIFPLNGKHHLCWKVELDGHAQPKPAEWVYFVDAVKGNVIFCYNELRVEGPTLGWGTGYYSGRGRVNSYESAAGPYQLRDTTRGQPEVVTDDEDGASPSEDADNDWDDTRTVPRRDLNQGAEVDVHIYAGGAVDYFHTIHGRNGYDNQGSTVESVVHYGNNENNAYYSPTLEKILIGDGDGSTFDYLGADDVVAHEFTHAVTHSSFDPVYHGESGAIDEAFSDCFAVFVTGDWLIGEEVRWGTPLRNLENPANSGNPDHYDDRYTGSGDNGGVHINSTIISHATYLMTVGGTHRKSGVTVASIGQAAVETMLYNVQTVQLIGNRTPTFLEFRKAMLDACLDLYPEDLEKLASVKAAFKAVGIGPDLYLRDTVSDIGLEPNPAGLSWWSPDIIVRKSLPANPQTEFADPNRNDLSENVEYGQDNYVFVRITNGGNHAADADVDVYFCPVTTFASPDAWQYLGTITEYNIVPGEFRISRHLVFPTGKIPAPGHYCFVGVVRTPLDPAPDHTLINTVSEFGKFIQYSNNYAWKNVFVVDDILPMKAVPLQFDIRNIPQGYMRADLQMDLRGLPEGSEFEIRLPQAILRGVDLFDVTEDELTTAFFKERVHGLQPFHRRRRIIDGRGRACFIIKPRKLVRLKRMFLRPGQKVRAKATVRLPHSAKGKQFTLSFKQIVDNMVVGEVSYVLRLKEE